VATNSENVERRARAIRTDVGDLAPDEILAVPTEFGTVNISSVHTVIDGGRSHVEVSLAGTTEGGDPNFVIVNPPTLVEDPNGDVIRGDGKRFRRDPAAALATVIASLGGAQSNRKGRRPR
jgi:hypothetical protein